MDAVFHYFGCYALWQIVQGVFVLLVAFVRRDKGFLLILCSLMI